MDPVRFTIQGVNSIDYPKGDAFSKYSPSREQNKAKLKEEIHNLGNKFINQDDVKKLLETARDNDGSISTDEISLISDSLKSRGVLLSYSDMPGKEVIFNLDLD